MKRVTKKNLSKMISSLEPIKITVADLENLLVQTVMDSEETRDKLNAIKLLIDIKKHLDTDDNSKELLDILRGE
jgi:hypothetical protein